MKTKKLLSILMATTMTIGIFAPTVAFAQDLNSINTEVVQQEVKVEKSKIEIVDNSMPIGYYPEENAVVFDSLIDIDELIYYNPPYLDWGRDVVYRDETKKIKISLDATRKDIKEKICEWYNLSNLVTSRVLPVIIDKEFNNTRFGQGGERALLHDDIETIGHAIERTGVDVNKIDLQYGVDIWLDFYVYENNIIRNANVNYEVITQNGKKITPKEMPKLANKVEPIKILPSDPFILTDEKNKALTFEYLCEGSKFNSQDLLNQEITVHLNYCETPNGALDKKNYTTEDIKFDIVKDASVASESFEKYINSKDKKLNNKFFPHGGNYYYEYKVLEDITFDVKYIVKESAYDAETGTMRSESSYEVVTEDGKTLTNIELPNLPANNYEEKIDVNKELEDSLEFYEDNYLNTIDDDEIEEEQLNVHMVLNDGNVFDILIDDDDDLYDDITLKGLVESKGYKLEDVKEYSTKYVFVLDDDVFETDDDDEEDFEEDDDDDDKAERKHNKKSKKHRKNHK